MTDPVPDKQANFQGSVTGSAVDGGSVNAENIAGRDVNITHNYALPPAEKPTFPLHDIPYPQNPHFTGREEILQQVANTLSTGQTAIVTQTIAGLGGVGKTQVALAYCYANLHTYDLIYWLNADSEAKLGENMMTLAHRLKLIAAKVSDQKAAVQAVHQWLGQTRQKWLLVYDNADQIEPAQLTAYLPRTGNGHVLITSRNPNWRSLGGVLELNVFTLDEAVVFLLQRRGIEIQGKNTQWQEAAELAKALGFFPLALEHAAAYIEAKSSNFGMYHQLFIEHQAELWKRVDKPERYHATIITTWELALEQLKYTRRAIDLLYWCCFLNPKGIDLNLLVEMTNVDQKLHDRFFELKESSLALDEAVGALRRFSLIQRNGNVLSLHRLVQIVIRNSLSLESETFFINCIFGSIAKLGMVHFRTKVR